MMACQSQNPAGVPGTITSITPSTWYAGQKFQITITGTFPGGDQPGCTMNEQDEVAQSISYPINNLIPVPFGYADSTIELAQDGYDKGTFTPTQVTLTVKLGDKAPSGQAYIYLDCDGCDYGIVGGPVQIVGLGPSISSISPSAWFADQSYDITITGANFLTASDPGGPTELRISEGTGSVRLSNVTVVSATEYHGHCRSHRGLSRRAGDVESG